ncbi:MAG: hypothetical protein AAFN77_00285 [Planctomycetota bacterium]
MKWMHAPAMLLIVAFLVSLTACSGNMPTYEVAGVVEFEDGTRPEFGNIEFYSAQFKINARGKIQEDGTFTLSTYSENDGAVVGFHEVVIMQQVGNYLLAKSGGNRIRHDHGSLIDSSYFDYQTSSLSCEIKSDVKNEVRLVVKKLPRQTEDGMPLH